MSTSSMPSAASVPPVSLVPRVVSHIGPFSAVVRTAIVSTAHLPQSDLDILWEGESGPNGNRYPVVGIDPDSDDVAAVILHVSEDPYFEEGSSDTVASEERNLPASDALWRLLECARRHGITYLKLDRDGELVAGLPVFEEESAN